MSNRISVIVPTHEHPGRYSGLLNLLSSLHINTNISFIHEIIIVDNGGTLSGDLVNMFSHVRIIKEVSIGLNYARNAGIRNSTSEIVAFLDDDIVVSEEWSRNILEGHNHNNILCVGGAVIVKNPNTIVYPSWFSDYFLRFLVPPKFPDNSCIISSPYFLIGANMSFKKEVFNIYGFFDVDLDRKGKNLLSNGDIELMMRLPESSVLYQSGALVYEKIPQGRLKRGYMVRRVFWQGISDYVMIKKIGTLRFYDRKEIFFSGYLFNKSINTIIKGNFLESFCMIVRVFGYNLGNLYLKLKRDSSVRNYPPFE